MFFKLINFIKNKKLEQLKYWNIKIYNDFKIAKILTIIFQKSIFIHMIIILNKRCIKNYLLNPCISNICHLLFNLYIYYEITLGINVFITNNKN